MNNDPLEGYYDQVRRSGMLLSDAHARRWSTAVLNALGTSLDGAVKRALARQLPADLGRDLKGVFWLLHFRDPALSSTEFQKRVAKRSGNTDAQFARQPVLAVFAGVRQMIDDDLSDRVACSLPDEVAELWRRAPTE